MLLVGTPMPDRLRGRGQTKSDHWSSRLGVQLRANNPNWLNNFVTETAIKNLSTVVDRNPESQPETCMTGSGESSHEATDTTKDGMNTAKTRMKIGFWNVRTMFDTGRLAQVTAEMHRYGLDVIGVSESRWTGSGKLRTATGETVLYSGREDNQHSEGVAIILKKGVEKCLMEWKPINNRLIKVRLRGKQVNMSIIQCYAPTNDADDEEKDNFYELLQKEVDSLPRYDLVIVIGDLNAKVGKDNTFYTRTMGKHGCGVMNENGERLADFCTMNNLVIGGTLFPHPDIHKLTWCSPNGRDRNQIDHLLVNGRWRRSLQDVIVRRGADVGSDHHLVVATIKLKLRKTGMKANHTRRFDVEKLKDPKLKSAFTLALKNRFQTLQEAQDDFNNTGNIDAAWGKISAAYTESSELCLGHRLGTKKDWIKKETWDAIEQRRKIKKKVVEAKSARLKVRYEEEYSDANRIVKRLARADKRTYMEELALEAEDAAKRGDQGQLYKITKLICGKFQTSSSGPVKDKNGKLLTTEQEQENRWSEHFQELLNRPEPDVTAEIEEANEDLAINIDPPTIREIVMAIKTLKNNKAPGGDNLNAELFKAEPEAAASILQPLFATIWMTGQIPSDWTKGVIIKIPKKGALNDCNNWRGITLLSVPSKILAKIVVHRISDAVDKSLRMEQAGFRKNRGCSDQIFTLRNIIEQCTEWQRQLYINFVDFEKAFDSIHRDSLWKILRSYGIPQKIVQIIQSFYDNFTCTVGKSSLHFQVRTGVRQGCVMSAILFNLVIDWVLRRTTEGSTRGIRWTLLSNLEDLDFADDLALLSHTHKHIQEKTDKLCTIGGQVGLKVSQKKTETMVLNVESPSQVKAYGVDLPRTEQFTYLGSIVRQDGGAENDIKNRLNKARNTMRSMNNIWKSSQYSVHTKLKLYRSCVLPTLLYGSECWRMTKCDANKLSTFHTTCLRRILRIFWPQKISNTDLLRKCDMDDLETLIMRKRWRWIGHVLRMDQNSITRVSLRWTPEGRRKRGRPKQTWRRTVEGEMKEWNHTWTSLEKLARNRQQWRNFVAALNANGVIGNK